MCGQNIGQQYIFIMVFHELPLSVVSPDTFFDFQSLRDITEKWPMSAKKNAKLMRTVIDLFSGNISGKLRAVQVSIRFDDGGRGWNCRSS